MKQIFTLILATLISVTGFAQSETLEQALARIANLEATVNNQSQQLAKISSDLDAVLAQNLALKKNLKLTPTIAKCKTDNSTEFRIIDVKGATDSKEIFIEMTAENVGNNDVKNYFDDIEIIDELGNTYSMRNNCTLCINQDEKINNNTLIFHPNVPLTLNLKIKGYSGDAQYLKFVKIFAGGVGPHRANAVFENLPIKWVDEIED